MRLTACQSRPAIDGAFYRLVGTLYQLQPSFHTHSTEPEPTARARRAGEEFYSTTPEFMFVSFRLLMVDDLQSASATMSYGRWSVRAARFVIFGTSRLCENARRTRSASISDATLQMDHNAVVLFTIDRLARSPRTTVRTRGTELAPDRWFIK